MIKFTMQDAEIRRMKEFEGFRAYAYQDGNKVWTIGYGHTSGVKPTDVITEAEGERYFKEDLRGFENFVNSLELCQNYKQFAALVDFAYNVGPANLNCSTLLKKIRNGYSESELRFEFTRWNKCNGKVLQGLAIRREWEADLYFNKI